MLPDFLYKMLQEQYEDESINKIIEGFSKNRKVTIRVNTIKTSNEKIKEILKENGIEVTDAKWFENALIIENVREDEIRKLDIYKNGEIYMQSLSSMIPAIVLNPQKGENILDMTAAPGGKTTQISAMTNNEALITACEKNKIRKSRLEYNIKMQGAKKINVMNIDSRNLDDFFSFDKILLDAPCSGSGTINLNDKQLRENFTEELIKRSQKVQYKLLKKAIKLLKKGNELVYSTCSILKLENEENINKILQEENVEIVPIEEQDFNSIPKLKTYINGTMCICPTELYEGFFVAKLKKK